VTQDDLCIPIPILPILTASLPRPPSMLMSDPQVQAAALVQINGMDQTHGKSFSHWTCPPTTTAKLIVACVIQLLYISSLQDNYEQAEIDQLCSRLDELQSQDILTPSTHVPTLPPLRFNTKYLVSEAYRMLSPIPLAGIKTPYVRCSYGHPTKSY